MMAEYMLSGLLTPLNTPETPVAIHYYHEAMVLFFSITVGNMVPEHSFQAWILWSSYSKFYIEDYLRQV